MWDLLGANKGLRIPVLDLPKLELLQKLALRCHLFIHGILTINIIHI